MASEINITPHRYIAIFRGRSCIEVRIDVVSNEYVSKLKKIKLTKNEIEEGISINYKLYEKVLNEMYADELHIFGMGEHGLIQIYEKSSNKFQTLEELGKPIYEDDGIKKLAVKKITLHPPQIPPSLPAFVRKTALWVISILNLRHLLTLKI